MSRAVLVLADDNQRERALDWVKRAPEGTRVEFKAAKRSLEQNARMWAMLTDVATQVRWGWDGERLSVEDWKDIFMHGLKRELRTAPDLDRKGVVALGRSTSDLSKQEMSDLLELIAEFGARNNVVFHEPQDSSDAA